jgi:hypothetical protein
VNGRPESESHGIVRGTPPDARDFPSPGSSEPGRATAGAGRSRPTRRVLPALLLLTVLTFAASVLAGARPLEIACWLASGAAWALAVEVSRQPSVPTSRASLAWILVGWAALRVPVLLQDPTLSDDVQRYVWEGRVVAEGASPYAFAPSAPELARLRGRWPGLAESVNHPEVPAAYPPLTELVFAATTTLAGRDGDVRGSISAFRVLFTACDLAVLLLILRWLRDHREPPWRAVVWAWCPLTALEYAGSAHFDALAIALLVAAVVVLDSGARARTAARAALASALLAAGALVKILPAALFPWVWRGVWRGEQRARGTWAGILAVLAMAVLALAPLAFARGGLAGFGRGISEYAFRWESFSLVHRWIERFLDPRFLRDESWTDPRRLARACTILAWLLLAMRAFASTSDPGRAARTLVGGFLVLTATLHPWYLTWIAPFLARHPSRAWTFLLAAAPLLYWPLEAWKAGGAWREPAWLWPVVALPFLALLAAESLARSGRAREART